MSSEFVLVLVPEMNARHWILELVLNENGFYMNT